MKKVNPNMGMSTLVNQVAEAGDPLLSHVTPIYETSTFRIPDLAAGERLFKGDDPGYLYTRLKNPNFEQLAAKIAYLEGIDLLRAAPDKKAGEVVAGQVFSTGMAAVSTAILCQVKAGQTIITHEALYGATYNFMHDMLPRMNVQTVFLKDTTRAGWEKAFKENPGAVLAYAETPSNPTLSLVDIHMVAEIAHAHGCPLMVDNTFATPYCQRPLSLGADIVVHSTTKGLSGHGLVIGGALVSRDPSWVKNTLNPALKLLGGTPSPFDAWLVNIGLKTFAVRMKQQCENAERIATFLEQHMAVERVLYPGLTSHPEHALAGQQMSHFGSMLSFELKGGYAAAEKMLKKLNVITFAVSLGNTDTLIMHPASTSHLNIPKEVRLASGITDGLMRLSVGIEDVEDLCADLDQAMK